MKPFGTDTAHRRRTVLNVSLTATICVLLLACHLLPESLSQPSGRFTQTYFRPLDDGVDCDLVFAQLRLLYEESKVRQAAWARAGRDLHVVAREGIDVTELHIVMRGDSWGNRKSWSILRYLDLCRLRLPQPLVARDECSLLVLERMEGHAVYQLSKSALGLASGPAETSGFLRVVLHFTRVTHSVEAASELAALLGSGDPTPGLTVTTFPADAKCRPSLDVGGGPRIPLCLCDDTVKLPGADRKRRVPFDVLQLITQMWDVYRPTMKTNAFEFGDTRIDWYMRRERLSPNLTEYPFITWEENLARVRRFMVERYVTVVRDAVRGATTPEGVPMPHVLLSIPAPGNCTAKKFTSRRTLSSVERCMTLSRPLHALMSDATLAAYGKPLLGMAAAEPPGWLRLVDYRPLSATSYDEHLNYTGASVAPGEYLCTLSDAAHFDTWPATSQRLAPHIRWCAVHVHALFWQEMVGVHQQRD